MKRLSSAILVLVLLGAALTACGPQASPTAVPPTKPPEPTKTPAPTQVPESTARPALPAGEGLDAEPYRSAEGGYTISYPEGWQNFGFGGMVLFFRSEQVMESDVPTDTVVMVEGGQLAALTLAEADLSGTMSSREMLELTVEDFFAGDTTFQVGEIYDVDVNGTLAAAVDFSGEEADIFLGGRIVCIHLGENGINVFAYGVRDAWADFTPTFDAMVASMTFFAPEVPTMMPEPTTGPEPTAGPAPTLVGGPPDGFTWRVGGESGFGEGYYGAFRGLALGPDGNLYVADSWQGIYVFSPDGEELNHFGADLSGVSDVKFGPDGNLYVASWSTNGIHIFTADGEDVGSFGEVGPDEGQFGDFAPEFLAVCPDGRVYVSDENKDAEDNYYERIQVFDAEGKYLFQWSVSEYDDFFDISGMDCDAEGNLYTSGYFGDYVIVWSGEGEHLADLGKDALYFAGAYGVSVGPGGDLYVGTWDGRVIVLDADGNLIGEWGVPFEGEGNLAEGQIYNVYGIVADDYGYVYITDYTGYYTYLTKFMFGKG
jgi:sugar lactone lactonase YvrE